MQVKKKGSEAQVLDHPIVTIKRIVLIYEKFIYEYTGFLFTFKRDVLIP
jgi:hypothetical protein